MLTGLASVLALEKGIQTSTARSQHPFFFNGGLLWRMYNEMCRFNNQYINIIGAILRKINNLKTFPKVIAS